MGIITSIRKERRVSDLPNAPTHDVITLVTAAAADIAYFRVAPHPDSTVATLFTVTYLFAGYACAGDLDLNSREYRRWGPLRFLWWPYRNLVPHRSWVSCINQQTFSTSRNSRCNQYA